MLNFVLYSTNNANKYRDRITKTVSDIQTQKESLILG